MYKKIEYCFLLILSILVFALSNVPAVAQPRAGSACESATLVTGSYSDTITTPGEYWYSAWTYDLPLKVTFTPAVAQHVPSPFRAEIDFTCTPGVYADSIMQKLFTDNSAHVQIPIQLDFTLDKSSADSAYTLSISQSYRQMLTTVGISYDVQAYVKVNFQRAGIVKVEPDTAYRECLQTATYLHKGDSITILPNDSDRVLVLPWAEWIGDSLRLEWNGKSGASLDIYTTGEPNCNFAPTGEDPSIWYDYHIADEGSYTFQANEIQDFVTESENGGVFYAKMLSVAPGMLYVGDRPIVVPDTLSPDTGSILPPDTIVPIVPEDTLPIIHMGDTVMVERMSQDVWRLLYSEMRGGDLTVAWNGNSACPVYLADTALYSLDKNASHLLKDANGKTNGYLNVQRRSSLTRDTAAVAAWANQLGEDSTIYVWFEAKGSGMMIFTSVVPEPDTTIVTPPDTLAPLPAAQLTATIEAICDGEQVKITVSEEQLLTLENGQHAVLKQWLQRPEDEPYIFIPTPGETYLLRGKTNTIRIVR